jgi:Helix-turn-helix domain
MPTVPRRPAAQRERDRLEGRRLRAAELFAAGVHQAKVARQLKVSAQAVSVWHARWQRGGSEALHSRGPSGPASRLSGCPARRRGTGPAPRSDGPGVYRELWSGSRW